MYAVIKTGGKQYRVSEGDTIKLEKLDIEAGKTIDFKEVLMLAKDEEYKIGDPYVEGGKVTAKIVDHGRADKVKIVKFRRRKDSKNITGHRQDYTEVTVTGISGI